MRSELAVWPQLDTDDDPESVAELQEENARLRNQVQHYECLVRRLYRASTDLSDLVYLAQSFAPDNEVSHPHPIDLTRSE